MIFQTGQDGWVSHCKGILGVEGWTGAQGGLVDGKSQQSAYARDVLLEEPSSYS